MKKITGRRVSDCHYLKSGSISFYFQKNDCHVPQHVVSAGFIQNTSQFVENFQNEKSVLAAYKIAKSVI
jgi:hypothetical protein